MTNSKKIFTIPNVMSMFRIALIPFILYSYFAVDKWVTFGLVVLSALTDVVDGFIARRYNMISDLGKVLDPIADKLTQFAFLICLGTDYAIVWILFAIFVIKELSTGVEAFIIWKHKGEPYSSKWFGKLSTVLLYATALLHIVWSNVPDVVSIILIVLCNVVVVFSFVNYTIINVNYIKNLKQSNLRLDNNEQQN